MFFLLFREFRNAFFEILHYNNCQCSSSSENKIRTSISKSNHSMNTKVTPQGQSRQASMTPSSQPPQRNGHLNPEKFVAKIHLNQKKSESTDTFELQTLAQQRPTLEAFDELEHLVPNGVTFGQATLVDMSSLLYDQDEDTNETSLTTKSLITVRTDHS